jgi:hypothetical protein
MARSPERVAAEVIDTRVSSAAGRVVLAVVTVVLLLSQIGFLLVPLLLPAHVWAARRSGPVGRVGWSLLPAAGLATAAWAVVYVTIGEAKPVIWLVPLVALVAAFALVRRFVSRGPAISTAI